MKRRSTRQPPPEWVLNAWDDEEKRQLALSWARLNWSVVDLLVTWHERRRASYFNLDRT